MSDLLDLSALTASELVHLNLLARTAEHFAPGHGLLAEAVSFHDEVLDAIDAYDLIPDGNGELGRSWDAETTAMGHRVTVVRPPGFPFSALCRCAWSGRARESAGRAADDGLGHLDSVRDE